MTKRQLPAQILILIPWLPGDNLSAIAKQFETTVAAIQSANGIFSDFLSIGQVLTIPTALSRESVEEEQKTFVYSARSGDSLSVIAKRFDVTVDRIRTGNQLKSDVIQVGQALTIPFGENTPTETEKNTTTFANHTIKSGDNIWDLSIRYGIPQQELFRTNNLTRNSNLSIGQTLKIPVHNIAVNTVTSENHGKYLDWWTEAQYVFIIGKTAKVTDIVTGKSFTIKRKLLVLPYLSIISLNHRQQDSNGRPYPFFTSKFHMPLMLFHNFKAGH